MALSSPTLFATACFMAFLVSHVAVCQGAGPRRSFISWSDITIGNYRYENVFKGVEDSDGSQVLFVSKNGGGDSTTVQGAVDKIPDGNSRRVKILISPGVYNEKVVVPNSKPFVSFIGNGSFAADTVIWYNLRASDRYPDGGMVGTYDSATVAIESDYFCAYRITFQNSAPAAVAGEEGEQAVALRLSGDKAMVHRCRILGSQDTLFDHFGRHYYYQSYIEGSIDFIFGSARSLYDDCTLLSVAKSYGAIAASQRKSPMDNMGFSFVGCKLYGTGMVYLGRAWGSYATVVYSNCKLEGIVIPQGWDDFGDPARRATTYFGQYNCRGEGADLTRRVPWAKALTYEEAKPYLSKTYVNGDQWLQL
ncbi:hypothetical protein Cni_G00977 [Canna indica]|uniref:Pectinesterase n=1 Tax=Canna indica TaxID=4628 RepID=A0AAQ3JLP7_9LILI|nr:hypothetical protein Cni_G00977 [Canna indica]